MKQDHWEFNTAEDLAKFVREQEKRLGYPTRQDMAAMTSPRVSDSALGQAYAGKLDPANARPKTLAGLQSLETAEIGNITPSPEAGFGKQRCPQCGGRGWIMRPKRTK